MNIIAIGAHPDDIEFGCGGTLAAHAKRGDTVVMITMTAGEHGGANAETRLQEFKNAAKILGVAEVICLNYQDTSVPHNHEAIQKIEDIINKYKPGRAYVPFMREIHQDHYHTSLVSLAACRNLPQILMYEGPCTFPDFVVSYLVDITKTIEVKINALKCHKSQGDKEILKIDSICSLNRFRGYQARIGYAEGFATFRFIERL